MLGVGWEDSAVVNVLVGLDHIVLERVGVRKLSSGDDGSLFSSSFNIRLSTQKPSITAVIQTTDASHDMVDGTQSVTQPPTVPVPKCVMSVFP